MKDHKIDEMESDLKGSINVAVALLRSIVRDTDIVFTAEQARSILIAAQELGAASLRYGVHDKSTKDELRAARDKMINRVIDCYHEQMRGKLFDEEAAGNGN